jgi:hypothetical protein
MIGHDAPYLGVGDPDARRALARRRRRRRVRLGLAWVLAGIVLAGGCFGLAMGGRLGPGYVRTHTRWLDVTQVDVDPTPCVPPWEVVDLAGVMPGDDFLDVNPDTVAARIVRHPRIGTARVEKSLWHRTVQIRISEKLPVAIWLEGGMVEVAADGTLLGSPPTREDSRSWPPRTDGARIVRGLGLPLLTGVDSLLAMGGRLRGPAALEALRFLERIGGYDQPGQAWLSEVCAAQPESLVAVTMTGISVKIGDGRLGRRTVEALRSVIEQVRSEGNAVQYLDARFRNQVVLKGVEGTKGKEGEGPDA